MEATHRAGAKHGNAEALSRIQDPLSPCSDYIAGIQPADLPKGYKNGADAGDSKPGSVEINRGKHNRECRKLL